MDYPLTLLPQANYKLIQCDLSPFCLVRHSRFPQDQLVDELGKLKDEVIAEGAEKLLPDYSTSLYGIFKLDDIKIKMTNSDYLAYCIPNFEVKTPVFEDDFVYVNTRSYWSILINDIHNQEIKYEDNSLSAICEVKHTPMKWNFWHFSINWFLNDINDYWHKTPDYHTKTIRRKLISEARGLLKEFGKPELVTDAVIEKEHYSI